ncbi:MAG: type I-B CRISPR-associated protein Cas5 [Bacteroidetes bacterium]|nr:MAG: type I-B CRISPR-associated protein Cas5 [Bacteroidota bacterium]
MKQMISFDIQADFGFLKKPDTNEPMYLTFNMIHKPCVLGLLGAILGERGFEKNEELPAYYVKLQNTLIGIKPLNAEEGNFAKTVIQYNNGVGYANKDGGNLIVVEQTLVKPAYRIYVLTDHEELLYRIQHHEAEFLPYLGKNDFSLWWDNVQLYEYEPFIPRDSYQVSSIFIKKSVVKEGIVDTSDMFFLDILASEGESFMYFERLPTGYDEVLYQYTYEPFVLTTFKLRKTYKIDNLYQLNGDEIIQVF